MEQNANLVVLIAMNQGIIVKGIQRKLAASEVNVVYSTPDVKELSSYDEQAAIYVVYISGDIDQMLSALVFLNDEVKESEKDLMVICENSERETLQLEIPGIRVSEWFIRPLDTEIFAESIKKALNLRENRKSTKSVLIVDDDPSFAMMMRDWLKEYYQVFIVTSGMQAITFLFKRKADLILLDYEMPVTTGPQVLRMLRSEPETKDIPIVFLTGIGDAESVKQVISLKPDGYLLKSTPRVELLNWLRLFFGKKDNL